MMELNAEDILNILSTEEKESHTDKKKKISFFLIVKKCFSFIKSQNWSGFCTHENRPSLTQFLDIIPPCSDLV